MSGNTAKAAFQIPSSKSIIIARHLHWRSLSCISFSSERKTNSYCLASFPRTYAWPTVQ